jgi:predicted HTH transcriptional regulator
MAETNRIEYKAQLTKEKVLVEQLGSGIPRILETYGKECFQFSANFLRMVFPSAEPVNTTEQVPEQATEQVTDQAIDQVADQATDQVKALLSVMINEHNRSELMDFLNLSHNHTFRQNYLHPAIEKGLIELTIPDKPNSSKQKYRLTAKGKQLKEHMK